MIDIAEADWLARPHVEPPEFQMPALRDRLRQMIGKAGRGSPRRDDQIVVACGADEGREELIHAGTPDMRLIAG